MATDAETTKDHHSYENVVSELGDLLEKRKDPQNKEYHEEKPVQDQPKQPKNYSAESSSTGIKEFDEILDGGFPKGAVVLLAGSSGSGKTILSFQWLFEGVKQGEHGLYISLTEPLFKIVQNLEKMSFYDRVAVEQESLRIVDIRDRFSESKYDPKEIISFIEALVKESDVKRLCIDSITAIAYHYNDKAEIRSFIFELGKALATLGCTTIMTSEVSRPGEFSVYDVEEFISDAILRVDQTRVRNMYQRQLRIVKVRGKSFRSEAIPMKIAGDGIHLFPKVHPPLQFTVKNQRFSTGNDELDAMIDGGVIQHSSTLLAGSTGTGKTLLSLGFIMDGLRNGEQCLFVGFEESRDQLLKNASSFGWDLASFEEKGLLHLYCAYPGDCLLEEHFFNIQEIIEQKKISRCVIDSLSAIAHEFEDREFSDFAIRLNGFLKNNDVTSFFTAATGSLVGGSIVVGQNLSTLTDGIIMLRYVEMQGKLESVINVLKLRGSDHVKDLRRYIITSDEGLSIRESLTNFEGVMTGSGKRIKELEEESERLKDIIEEKERTENELKKVTRAIEQSPTSIVIADTNGDIEYVNPAFTKITGYSEDEVKGQNPRILKSGEQTAEFYEDLWNTISSGETWHGTFHNKKKNGELFWEQASISPVKNKEGSIAHYVAVKEDITERKMAEEQLKKSEEQFRGIFESLQNLYYRTDLEGNIELLSPSIEQLTGYTQDELAGHNVAEIYKDPGEREVFLKELKEQGKVQGFELQLKRKNGEIAYASVNSHLVFDENNNPVGVEGTINDITERKKMEEKIKESEKHFKSIFSHVQTGIILIDAETHIIKDVNPAASAMLRSSKDEIVGNVCHKFVCPANKDQCPKETSDTPIENSERCILRSDKTEIPVLKTVVDINIHGRPHYLETFVDISKQKEAESELKGAKEEVESILNAAADGIRIVGKDLRVKRLNQTMADMAGISIDEGIDMNCSEMFASKSCGTGDCSLKKVLETKKGINRESVRKRPDGKEITVLEKVSPYFNAVGEIVGIIEDFRDIEVLKQKENELIEAKDILRIVNKQLGQKVKKQTEKFAEEKNLYQALIQNIPQKIFHKNKDLTYVFANDNFLEDVGLTLDEIKGKTDYDLFPPHLAEKYTEDDKGILETGEVIIFTEKFHKNEEEIEVKTIKAPVKDKKGSITGIIGIFWEDNTSASSFQNKENMIQMEGT
ncbi:MAG: circadian clock protein KaiC [Thermoplasmatota archaeon]